MVLKKLKNPLLYIISAAFLIRLLYLLEMSVKNPFFYNLFMDARSYNSWAQDILNGNFLGSGVFYQAPLYPYFLALIYKIFGYNLLIPRLIQVILDTFSCFMIYRISAKLFSRKSAYITAALYAFNGVFVFYSATLLKTTLAAFLTSASLLFLIGNSKNRGKITILLAGIFSGLLAITRGNTLLLVPVIILWTLFKSSEIKRHRITDTLLFIIGFLTIISPVTARNYFVGNDIVLTTFQGGTNLYIGNNPYANGSYQPLVPGRQTPGFEKEDAVRIAEAETGRVLKPSEVSSFWVKKSLAFIVSKPGAYFKLLWEKIKMFFSAYESIDAEDYYFFKSSSFFLKFAFIDYSFISPLFLMTMIIFYRSLKNYIYPVLLTFTHIISVVLFFVFGRYRLPVVIPIIIISGISLVKIEAYIRKRNIYKNILMSICFISLFYITNHGKNKIISHNLSVSYLNISGTYIETGFYDKALEYALLAADTDPEWPAVYFSIANIYKKMGYNIKALEFYNKTLELNPKYIEARAALARHLQDIGRADLSYSAWNDLKIIDSSYPGIDLKLSRLKEELNSPLYNIRKADTYLHIHNDPEKAVLYFQKVLDSGTEDTLLLRKAHYELGRINFKDKDYSSAERHFLMTIKYDPENPRAYEFLGNLSYMKNDYKAALDYWKKSYKLDPENAALRANISKLEDHLSGMTRP